MVLYRIMSLNMFGMHEEWLAASHRRTGFEAVKPKIDFHKRKF